MTIPTTLLRISAVKARAGLSRSAIYRRMAKGEFPLPIHVGNSLTVRWIEHEIRQWIEDTIRKERGKTITTAIEQADGLGAGEATSASGSIPTVSEPPIQLIRTRNSSYKHPLRCENTRSQREHHFNELERIRRENEMAEAG